MKRRCVSLFGLIIILSVCIFAHGIAEEIVITMDTWEQVPFFNTELNNFFVRTEKMLLFENSDFIELPWEKEQTALIWVSGWIIPPDQQAYRVINIQVGTKRDDIILFNRVAHEWEEIYGRTIPNRLRISFCIAIKKDALYSEKIEEALRNLTITADVEKVNYKLIDDNIGNTVEWNNSAYEVVNVLVDLHEVKERLFTQFLPIVAKVTSLDSNKDARPEGNLYRIGKEFIEGGLFSFWKVRGEISTDYRFSIMPLAYVNDQVKFYYDDFDNTDTQRKITLDMIVPFSHGDITNKQVFQLLKDAHLTFMITFEPPMTWGEYMMGPFYPVEVDLSIVESIEN